MFSNIHSLVVAVATLLQYFSVMVLVLAVIGATAVFAAKGVKSHDWRDAFDQYRANLGRGILLGLELLVAADIIATVTEPLSFDRVGPLAAIVLIRTFLSFALETEIQGRWPWRRADADPGEAKR
ncbi:DUF1622 domain-containing protein [Phenylobacterium sp.]|jgi:uncharacterized membrane protein|uniref:DUF1622 domain-containing protein n=1 Tax=Phenylobacterium sp. TaxID=1871053 RepID=UPI000C947E49|nr:DUF1622 domain-containing protein [Phenylobacterium sp.]MAK81969.1 hypothetical protein [Phenylobacterium sp.]|tara:strand:- start:47420 stop:47794 length:375 start_codon:yes stop_codon:yes gene_type:complete